MTILTRKDLRVGATYRAKKPRWTMFGECNDRTILHMDIADVQYDSISVAQGRRYPKVSGEFLAWASHEFTGDDS